MQFIVTDVGILFKFLLIVFQSNMLQQRQFQLQQPFLTQSTANQERGAKLASEQHRPEFIPMAKGRARTPDPLKMLLKRMDITASTPMRAIVVLDSYILLLIVPNLFPMTYDLHGIAGLPGLAFSDSHAQL